MHIHIWRVACITIIDAGGFKASAPQFDERCVDCGKRRRRLEAPVP